MLKHSTHWVWRTIWKLGMPSHMSWEILLASTGNRTGKEMGQGKTCHHSRGRWFGCLSHLLTLELILYILLTAPLPHKPSNILDQSHAHLVSQVFSPKGTGARPALSQKNNTYQQKPGLSKLLRALLRHFYLLPCEHSDPLFQVLLGVLSYMIQIRLHKVTSAPESPIAPEIIQNDSLLNKWLKELHESMLQPEFRWVCMS